MTTFWKAFFVGVVFSLLMILLIPLFTEGISPAKTFSIIMDFRNPLKAIGIIQMILVISAVFGLLFSLISHAGNRSKEKSETDRLMREYLAKKLKEENYNKK